MNTTDVIAALRQKGYPDDPDLTDEAIAEAQAHVERELKWRYPITTFGTFNTVPYQQRYDLFNSVSNPATSQGVFPGGIWVVEMVYSPLGEGANLDVFGIAPFMQGLSIAIGEISTYSFQTPTDFAMWDLNWNSFVKRFGMLDFRHSENRPGSPVELYPMPRDTNPAFVRYQRYRTAAEMEALNDSWYLELIEGQCSRTVANKMSMSAGTAQGKVSDNGLRAKWWDAKADKHYKDGWAKFEAMNHEIIAGAQRS